MRGRGVGTGPRVVLPVLGVRLRSVSDDEDWRLHGLEGEKGGGEEEEVGRALKGVGGPEDEGRSSPNTGLPGEHDTHTHMNKHLTLSVCVYMCVCKCVRHWEGDFLAYDSFALDEVCLRCYGWLEKYTKQA